MSDNVQEESARLLPQALSQHYHCFSYNKKIFSNVFLTEPWKDAKGAARQTVVYISFCQTQKMAAKLMKDEDG